MKKLGEFLSYVFFVIVGSCVMLFVVATLPFTIPLMDRAFAFLTLWAGRILLVLAWPIAALLVLACVIQFETLDAIRVSSVRLRALMATASIPLAIMWAVVGVPPSADYTSLSAFSVLQTAIILMSVLAGYHVLQRKLNGDTRWRYASVALLTLIFACAIFPPVWTILASDRARAHLGSVEVIPQGCDAADAKAVVAHISDLHITEKGQRTREGNAPGNVQLPITLKRMEALQPAWLVVSGDLTDDGSSAQWQRLQQLLSLEHGTMLAVTPGNHDLNLYFGPETRAYEVSAEDAKRHELEALSRLARVASYQQQHANNVTARDGSTLGAFFEHLPNYSNLNTFPKEIAQCIETCGLADGLQGGPRLKASCSYLCENNWRKLLQRRFDNLNASFPWTAFDAKNGIAIISLLSVDTVHDTLGQNAIGNVDNDQIDGLAAILKNLPAKTSLIVLVLHHPLFLAKAAAKDATQPVALVNRIYDSDWFKSIFLANNVEQAQKVYELLQAELERRPDASGAVLFGHRHVRTLSKLGRVLLVEAPNIGTIAEADVGFYFLSMGSHAGVAAHWCPMGKDAK